MNYIIISPEFDRLIKKIKEMKAEIISILVEKYELLYKKKQELINIYVRSIGKTEIELSDIQAEVARVKYIIDMIKIRRQFKRKIDLEGIEKKAREEGSVFFEAADTEGSEDEKKKKKPLNKYEVEELKLIYRKVIKLLHPDLGTNRTEDEEKLLKDAIEAYEYRDVYALKSIAAALRNTDISMSYGCEGNILTALRRRVELLRGEIDELRASVKLIRTDFPFNQEQFLSDPEKVEMRRKKMEAELEAEKEKLEKLRDRLRYYKISARCC